VSVQDLPQGRREDDSTRHLRLGRPLHQAAPHFGDGPGNGKSALAYAVAALRRLVNRGRFEPSEAVTRALGEYRRKTDTATGFLEERCVFEPAATERRSTLYETYVQWCKDNGRQALGASRFNERVESGWEASTRRVKGIWEWKGLRLRTVSDGADEKSW
jgi:phage/plasmid-associated DNA primase